MEARKVYVSGGSTYVISLPKKWVKKTNLKAGDSLIVTEHGSSLMIETSIIENESRIKEINISQIKSSDALERLLIAFYLVGYDTIKIKLDRKDHFSERLPWIQDCGKSTSKNCRPYRKHGKKLYSII